MIMLRLNAEIKSHTLGAGVSLLFFFIVRMSGEFVQQMEVLYVLFLHSCLSVLLML